MAKCIADSTLGTAPDTYLYNLAGSGNDFATIGSDDALRVFDGSLKPLRKASPAHDGITCLSTFRDLYITAGRDGLIRAWDARVERSALEIRESAGRGISSIACIGNVIAAGTESTKEGLGDVSVLLYDARNGSAPLRNYSESHTDTITQLTFHPEQSTVLMSGSTDGLVTVFDTNVEDEEDAVQQVLNARSAVHCSGFLSPEKIYIVTTDEHFSLHALGDKDVTDRGQLIDDLGDLREYFDDCMYVVDLKPGPPAYMAYGHNVNQTLSLMHLGSPPGRDSRHVIDLPGAHGEDVVRDVMVLERERKALSCGEDGHVKVWDLPITAAWDRDAMDVEE